MLSAPGPAPAPTHPAQLAELLRQRESLRDVIETISSELALEPLLTRIVESAVHLLDAERGSIGLVIDEAGIPIVRTAAVYNMPALELDAEMRPGVGLAGRVLIEQRPVTLSHYGDLENPTVPELADDAVIGVPIWWRDTMIGFFGLGAKPSRPFTETDVETLTLLARHAAIAIHNARLFEAEQRRAARVAVINQVSRLVTSSLSLDQLLQTTVQAFDEHLHYSNIAILLVDPTDPATLVLRARGGIYVRPGSVEYRQSLSKGIIGAAATSQRHILVNDVRLDPRYVPIPNASDIRAELAVPLVVGDRLMGVLNLESNQSISEEDAASFEIIGDQLAVAIDNARLFERARERTERLELIARISQRIATRLDRDELFATTSEELHQRLGYDHVGVFLVDYDAPGWLVQRARASRWQRSPTTSYRQSLEEGIIGAAARQRAPVLVNDVAEDGRYVPVPTADDLRAELAVPIVSGARLLGVLDVGSQRRLHEEDVRGLSIVADQLAIALDNTRLFERTQSVLNETRLLYETSQRISTAMDVDEVVSAYLEQVAARGRYSCHVILYEHDANNVRVARMAYGRWTPEQGATLLMERSAYTEDELDPPLDAGQTITIADVLTDPRAPEALRKMQAETGRPALAFIPLMVRDQRIGLVVLSHGTVRAWSEADLQPYQATAAQLATAIDSRRQYSLLYERGQQLAVFQERQRLARELHDSVTQLLFSMTLIAQSIASAWRRDVQEGEKRINRLLELSQAALAEMRALLAELRPPDSAPPTETLPVPPLPSLERVRRDGLAQALHKYAIDLARDGLRVDIDAEGYARQPLEQEEALYRIAQEALNNVVKHAQARRVRIRLRSEQDGAHLTVVDDGVGLPPPASSPDGKPARRGLGLATMRERAEALGGATNVTANPGGGTMVDVLIPSS